MAPSVHSRARAGVVDAAKSLAPQILACREELESGRQLPPQLVQGMAASGLLQLFLPRSMGGPELDLTTAFHAVEAVSKVDGSVGWCSVISGGGLGVAGVGRARCGHVLLRASTRLPAGWQHAP